MVPAEQNAAAAKSAGDSQAAPAVAIRGMQRPVDSKDLIFIIGGPGCGKVRRQLEQLAAQEGMSGFKEPGSCMYCCTAVSQADKGRDTFKPSNGPLPSATLDPVQNNCQANLCLNKGCGPRQGTQSKLIAEQYKDVLHLSVGDLLRTEVKSGSALGKELEATMKAGELVETDQASPTFCPAIIFDPSIAHPALPYLNQSLMYWCCG